MAIPGSLASLIPADVNETTRRLRDLERYVSELAAVNWVKTLLDKANLAVSTGILTVLGALNVSGSLGVSGSTAITGPTTIGGTLGVTGTTTLGAPTSITGNTNISGTLGVTGATTLGAPTTVSGTLGVSGVTTLGAATTVSGSLNVTGPMTVGGTLSLPAGIIDNASLVSPITSAAAAPGTGSGFNVSTSQATKASTTIAVPSGYTQALVMAVGSLTMADTAANRFDTRCGIAGNYGAALPNLANTVGSTSAAHTRFLTGLSGGTITLEVQALAAVSATNAANTAIVTGFAIFFR